ncbi:saccharopine dehydrogenase-like oxidoreductase [Sceloporus undulatus]|uniref:saccharopine dehydrogenase-like oxidoreductase n=1 Tax=Sceloporus undulatus TaxID=8520 RepID=UPI001C4DA96B|nr:saccharopine dehydrogenase-like oxidoreductase [Sceloporus undulatus]
MATGRPFEMVVFAASGFTGQHVAEEVARVASEEEMRGSLRWAVAGRSREKLQAVLDKVAAKLGKPELKSEVGIILCDVSDPSSLANMAKQTAVVLNCVGPYSIFGEPVVKACVENGASCVDISGEPQFLEGIYLNYNDEAEEKGVYIVGSCGFDSIPADMGVLFTKNNLKGTLTALESFLTINFGPEGACLHEGTWQSAIYVLAEQGKLKKIRRQIGHKPIPVIGAKLKRRGEVFYCNELQKYSVPFTESDPAVVTRTQRYLHTHLQETPVQYAAYFTAGGLGSVIKLMFVGLWFLIFAKFNCGRKLLIKYPEFFSRGYFRKEGPTEKQIEGTSFEMIFLGEGYSLGKDPQQGKPDVKICTRVKGPEPGYVATPRAMVQAGVTLLKDKSSLPKKGGVYTPGAVFSKTKFIDRLNKHGIEFSVISKPEA